MVSDGLGGAFAAVEEDGGGRVANACATLSEMKLFSCSTETLMTWASESLVGDEGIPPHAVVEISRNGELRPDALAARPAMVRSSTTDRLVFLWYFNELPCLFGRISVDHSNISKSYYSFSRDHAIAQNTLKCYLKGTTYKLVTVDVDKDRRVNDNCSKHQNVRSIFKKIENEYLLKISLMFFFFKRHCAAMVYLQQTDWMLVLETDIGVVNPNHCIEEWIDDRVKVILYERFINGEISPVSYLIHVMKSVIPDAVQNAENCATMLVDVNNYDTYFSYVSCVKQGLGATKIWPKKIRILRRAHAWASLNISGVFSYYNLEIHVLEVDLDCNPDLSVVHQRPPTAAADTMD
ncbi:unnamed protein product [Nippostrongylus brasiliensis]|uniref:Tudor domain-containing protein n=1 Tax=Nippostrongylus brasiliensis TaxID=27835 RepID=A0A158QXY8_NIPBR|nr:unnamed protein product [Nippostrongylus brasiliensis]